MSALKKQIGGGHYKDLAIQPVEYMHKNGIGFAEGCVIKYVTRWRDKNGVEDLKKARHFLDLLIEMETPEQLVWPEETKEHEDRQKALSQNGNDGLVYEVVEKYQDDFVISRKQLQYAFGTKKRDALIVRTLPNLKGFGD